MKTIHCCCHDFQIVWSNYQIRETHSCTTPIIGLPTNVRKIYPASVDCRIVKWQPCVQNRSNYSPWILKSDKTTRCGRSHFQIKHCTSWYVVWYRTVSTNLIGILGIKFNVHATNNAHSYIFSGGRSRGLSNILLFHII